MTTPTQRQLDEAVNEAESVFKEIIHAEAEYVEKFLHAIAALIDAKIAAALERERAK